MKMLKAKLYEMELEKREAQNAAYQASKSAINFGSQIRNYVLAPYRLVKDARTSYETVERRRGARRGSRWVHRGVFARRGRRRGEEGRRRRGSRRVGATCCVC